MTNESKILLGVIGGLAVGFILLATSLFNAVRDVNVNVTNEGIFPVGAAGDEFTTARIHTDEWDTTTTATNTLASMYNGSGRDRLITDINMLVEGANTYSEDQCCSNQAALIFTMATSTGAGGLGSVATGTRAVLHTNISTSTAGTIGEYFASTTPGRVAAVPGNRLWPNGTFLNLVSNGVASSTFGTIAVKYIILD